MNSETGGIIGGNNGEAEMPPNHDQLYQDPAIIERVLSRLDSMEDIMGKVSDALDRLSRLEERNSYTKEGMERLGGRIDRQDERIASIQKDLASIDKESAKSGVLVDFLKISLGALIAWAATHGLPGA
jgi:uncharacterized membrane protein YccC